MWELNGISVRYQTRGIAKNGPRRGFWGQKLPKEGVLRVRKRCGHAPERRFVGFLVKVTKKFGPMGGVLTPISPPLATPLKPRLQYHIDFRIWKKKTFMTWLSFLLALNPIWVALANLKKVRLWKKDTHFAKVWLMEIGQRCCLKQNNIWNLFTDSFCAKKTVSCHF